MLYSLASFLMHMKEIVGRGVKVNKKVFASAERTHSHHLIVTPSRSQINDEMKFWPARLQPPPPNKTVKLDLPPWSKIFQRMCEVKYKVIK